MLELVGDGRALAGKLQGEDGVERWFSGWMELAGAIEAWRADAELPREGGSTSPGSPPPSGPAHGER